MIDELLSALKKSAFDRKNCQIGQSIFSIQETKNLILQIEQLKKQWANNDQPTNL